MSLSEGIYSRIGYSVASGSLLQPAPIKEWGNWGCDLLSLEFSMGQRPGKERTHMSPCLVKCSRPPGLRAGCSPRTSLNNHFQESASWNWWCNIHFRNFCSNCRCRNNWNCFILIGNPSRSFNRYQDFSNFRNFRLLYWQYPWSSSREKTLHKQWTCQLACYHLWGNHWYRFCNVKTLIFSFFFNI